MKFGLIVLLAHHTLSLTGSPCVPLKPPLNGAVVCVPWGATGQYCQQRCHKGYDLPYGVHQHVPQYRGVFTCAETHKAWRPTASVFDCVAIRSSSGTLTLPQKFHYEGHCSSTAKQREIKQEFLSSTSSITYICPMCTENDVSVNCGPVTCRAIVEGPINGENVSCTAKSSATSTCSVTCSAGYLPTLNVTSVTCNSDGRWSKALATCKATKCPPVPTVANAVSFCSAPLLDTTPLFGSSCRYRCNTGYIIPLSQQHHTVKCSSTGTWIGSPPSCVLNKHPVMTNCRTSGITMKVSSIPTRVTIPSPTFKSADGLRLVPPVCTVNGLTFKSEASLQKGRHQVVCKGQDTEIALESVCKFTVEVSTLVKCHLPPMVKNASNRCSSTPDAGNFYLEKTDCVYKCNRGYTVPVFDHHRSSKVSCGPSGAWVGLLPACIEFERPLMRNCPTKLITKITEDSMTKFTIPQPTFTSSDNKRNISTVCTIGGKQVASQIVLKREHRTMIDCSGTDVAISLTTTCNIIVEVLKPACSSLKPPKQGALACGPWEQSGRHCQLHCRQGYDLPTRGKEFKGLIKIRGYDGTYTCSRPYGASEGKWTPSKKMFGCVKITRMLRVELPVLFHFKGICPAKTTTNQIIKRFFLYLNNSLSTVCPTCNAYSISITCGNTRGKGKRFLTGTSTGQPGIATDSVKITATISTPMVINSSNTTDNFIVTSKRLETIALKVGRKIKTDSSKVASSFPALNLVSSQPAITLRMTRGDCQDGFTTSSKGACSACFPGSYFNKKTGNCDFCPLGTYSETAASLTCTACPRGYTTADDAAQDVSECQVCMETDQEDTCPEYAKKGLCSNPDVAAYCKKSCLCK